MRSRPWEGETARDMFVGSGAKVCQTSKQTRYCTRRQGKENTRAELLFRKCNPTSSNQNGNQRVLLLVSSHHLHRPARRRTAFTTMWSTTLTLAISLLTFQPTARAANATIVCGAGQCFQGYSNISSAYFAWFWHSHGSEFSTTSRQSAYS